MTHALDDEAPSTDSAVLEPVTQPPLAEVLGGSLGLGRELFRHPLFVAVLALKVVLGTLFASAYLRELFIPFVDRFVATGGDPWAAAVGAGGRLDSFPYPPLMLLALAIPRWLASPFLSEAAIGFGHLFVYRLPLLLADVATYVALCALLPHRVDRVRLLYWCSPLVIYVCYWHGQLDMIPTALLLLGVLATLRRRWVLGGALLGCALATKTHILVALPFLAVLLGSERRGRLLAPFGIAALVYGLAIAPVLGSSAFRTMVYGSEKQARVLDLVVPVGDLSFYVCPAALLVLLLRFAAYRKRNADLTMLYLALAFSVFVVLVPPMPGWMLWAFPFLVYACAKSAEIPLPLLPAFSLCYLGYFLVAPGSDLFDAFAVLAPGVAALGQPVDRLHALGVPRDLAVNLGFTLMETTLAVVIFATYRFGVRSNEIYRHDGRPIMVGIAGDSGAGKDHLSRLIAQALGVEQTTVVSGDDYHKWPRGHDAWQVYTHLDLRSNKLHDMVGDAIALGERSAIRKVSYDHETGAFTDPRTVNPTDFVLFVGLHTFVIERMRGLFDLRIFVQPDEQLRLFWKLRRDARHRSATPGEVLAAVERRSADREKHVLPQQEFADLVVAFYPLDPLQEGDLDAPPPRLGVRLTGKNSFQLDRLADALRAHAGLQVVDGPVGDITTHTLDVRGSIDAQEVRRLVQELVPNVDELTQGYAATLHADLPGVVQLTLLQCISQARRWRSRSDDPRGTAP